MKGVIVIFSILFLFPITSFAQVVINEIAWMGTANSHSDEWIELYNESGGSVDLTGWILSASDGTPSISLSENIISGGYFLLERTDDSSVPSVAADVIYKGALGNTGETLTLYDSAGTVIDKVVGGEDWNEIGGNNSTKETPQRSGSSWITASPTPGKINANSSSDSSGGDSVEETNTGSSSTSESVSVSVEPQISAYAGDDRVVIVGADSVFSGQAYGLNGEPLLNARYTWTFGNGQRKEGQKILHHYLYPGEYVVWLDVSSGEYSASDRMIVTAEPAQISISAATPLFIEIKNESKHELDISFWYLRGGDTLFLIPERTILLSRKSVKFPSSVTGIVSSKGDADLLYPNGNIAASYGGSVATYTPENKIITSQFVFSANPVVEKYTATAGTALEEKLPDSVAPTLAAAESAENTESDGNSIYKWLLALIGIIGVGIVAVLIARKRDISDEIKILE